MPGILRIVFLSGLLAGFSSCHWKRSSPVEHTCILVDSLIQHQWINEKTLMVSFGAEAITAIHTAKGMVIIDSGISTGLTLKYRRIIEQAFPYKPFTYVMNTHAHHDHYRGNSVFPEARVIAHKNAPAEMEAFWKSPEQVAASLESIANEYKANLDDFVPYSADWYRSFMQQIRYQSAYEDAENKVPIRIPDILVSDSLWIDMGDLKIELKYFGSCHSNSDILVFIPELKVLFTGDLMFQYGRPSIRDKRMTDQELWHAAIAWTKRRMDHIETVIGGHGQVLSRDDLQAFHRILSEKMI